MKLANPVILMGASVALALLWPIHVLPLPSFTNEWIAGMGVLLGACYLFSDTTLTVRWSPLLLVLTPLLITLLLHALTGRYAYFAQPLSFLIFFTVACFVSIFVSSIAGSTDNTRETVAYWFHLFLCLSAVLSAATAFAQWIGWDSALQPFVFEMEAGPDRKRPAGNISQPNLLATICGMGMISAWWLSVTGKMSTRLMAIASLFLAAGVGLTGSRMALIFVPFLVILLALSDRGHKGLRKSSMFWVGAPIAILVFHFLFPLLAPVLASPLISSDVRALDFSSDARLQLLKVALAALGSDFYLGRGVGTFVEYMPYLAAEKKLIGSGVAHHSHNLFLQLTLDFGVVSTLFFLLAFGVYVIKARWYQLRDTTSLSAIGILGILLIHSQFEFPLWYLHFWIIFVWAITLLDRGGLCQPAPAWVRKFLFLGSVVALAAGVHLYGDHSETRKRYQQVFEQSSPAAIEADDIRSYSLFKSQDEYAYHLLGQVNLPIMQEDLDLRRRAVKRQPAPAAIIRLAVVEQLAGNSLEARRWLDVLRVVEPDYASLIKPHLDGACRAFQRPEICGLAADAL